MYHKVVLIGALGRDASMRYFPSGDPVTDFSVATSTKWTGKDGQKQEETIWWKVQATGKLAEVCNEYLVKGSKVYIEGFMLLDPKTKAPRIWTRQDGTPSVDLAVKIGVAGSIIRFLSSKGETVHEAAGTQDPAEVPSDADEL